MEEKSRKLVNEDEIRKVVKLGRLGLPGLTKIIMDILRLSTINDIYEKLGNEQGLRFIDALFKEIEVDFDYFQEELDRIPKEGPFIVVANHPLGGIDGIILIRLISQVRPDFKVMANYLLQKIEPIKDYFLPVNPFEDRKEARSSFTGIKESLAHVHEGHGLGIFPAGEVSTYNFEEGKVIDRPWQDGAIRLIQTANVPVIPLYFKAKNSRLFYLLSAVSPTLRTAKLPSELLQQKGKNIIIRIGRAVPPTEYQDETVEKTCAILRERTYRLSNALEKDRKFPVLIERKPKDPEPIMEPVPRDLILRDIDRLNSEQGPLTVFRDYEVFCATATQAPNILLEIGRLREITFREVGEGTNLPQDIDGYDQHYLHLFLWDAKEQKLVGAYRLGMGADIYPKFGINGFYVHSLFRVDKELHSFMSQALEMGRAFVVREYQQKPMPLYLLWKGIMHVILRNPDKVRYLIGCVSISNQFSKYSKSLMIGFVKKHFFDPEMAEHIRPKKEFKEKLGPFEKALIDNTDKEDLNKFDKLLDDIEPGAMRFPVLLKKYIKQNAKIVAFNVDPAFNNSVDGLMYIDINDLPEQTLQPVLEELDAEAKKIAKGENGNGNHGS